MLPHRDRLRPSPLRSQEDPSTPGRCTFFSTQPQKLPAELALLSIVQHPNIIRLQQSYLSKDFLYLLFDYTQQRDLQKV